MVGTPYPSDFKHMLRGQSIKNCPVTNEDIVVDHKIFGTNTHSLEVKTTRGKAHAVIHDFVAIPKKITELHKNVVLTADIVFISKLAFILTLSRQLCFGKIQYVRSRKNSILVNALKKVISLYTTRGLNVQSILMDR